METKQQYRDAAMDAHERRSAKFETVQQFYERFDHMCIRCAGARMKWSKSECKVLWELELALFDNADDLKVLSILSQSCEFKPASTRLMRSWAVEEGAA